jgi:hypothetical protein
LHLSTDYKTDRQSDNSVLAQKLSKTTDWMFQALLNNRHAVLAASLA